MVLFFLQRTCYNVMTMWQRRVREDTSLEHLFEKLKNHSESDMYPYHMPGHKRRSFGMLPKDLYELDITEIDGFDNLHQPEEILKTLQENAAALYGAEESFYLVNGSTCGILSAVSSALPAGGHILMARNCHKSAYHAAYLRNLTVSYLYPPYLSEYDICDAVSPEQVRAALAQNEEIGAVLIVSPTYEGRIADVREIAKIVHERGIPLIVDEAHGAHLGLAEGFAQNSCQAGADLVIHSTHKTFPALTQTALLHVNGELVDRNILKRFLHIYQSSSPSYLLMASIDNCLQNVKESKAEIFARFKKYYEQMCEELQACRYIKFLPADWKCQDVGKLLISVKGTSLSGKQLYDILRDRYHMQLEMAQESFCLAMFTVNDDPEAYRRMSQALLEVDAELAATFEPVIVQEKKCTCKPDEDTKQSLCNSGRVLPLWRAWDAENVLVPLAECVGKVGAEFINLYPPGIPLLVPGEMMTENLCNRIVEAVSMDLNVQGIIKSESNVKDAAAKCPKEVIFVKVLKENRG